MSALRRAVLQKAAACPRLSLCLLRAARRPEPRRAPQNTRSPMKAIVSSVSGNTRMYLFLFLLTLGSTIGLQGSSLLYTNYAVEVGGFSAADNGLVVALREVPGFLCFLVVPLMLVMREHRLCVLSVLICGVGTAVIGLFSSFWGIAGAVFVMSAGYHFFETINQSLMIQYYDLSCTPLIMGRMRGLAAGGSLAVSLLVFFGSGYLSYETMFALMGAVVVALGAACLFFDPSSPKVTPQKKGMVFCSRYWLFYALTLLMGGRRQIFTVFSLFLLVEKFGFSVRTVAILYMVNYAVNWFFNPLIGRIINRIGERRLLTIEYTSAFFIFLGYAWTDSAYLAGFMYVLDSLTFNFAIAVRTFFQKIADPSDVAPSMGLAQTINHIAAVLIPPLGGWLWVSFGYQLPFYCGMGLTVLSLLRIQFMDREIAKAGKRS